VDMYSDVFAIALSSSDITSIFSTGKIASLIGIEGGHAIDSALGSLRQFYTLGARYMTLTHSCSTPWAQSCANGSVFVTGGLSSFGLSVVYEMNRLGMLIDLAHVDPSVMNVTLNVSKAPIIFSHSSVYTLCATPRNVPDWIIDKIPANGGIIMVNFYSDFINCTNSSAATLAQVANHIDYIKQRIGVSYIGIGGDYDGVPALPAGLEDVSKYPGLFAELIRRGYSDSDVISILGGNMLRVFRQVEQVSASMKQQAAETDESIISFNFTGNGCRTQGW